MPKIRTASLNDHTDAVWAALIRGLECLLRQKSYEELTVGEIAAAAGMARNTIYNYAPDKAGLVAKAAELSNQGLLDQVEELVESKDSPAARLARLMATVIAWYGNTEHRPLLVQTLFRPIPDAVHKQAGAPLRNTTVLVARIVREGLESGDFQGFSDPNLIVDFLSGAVTRAALRVVEDPDSIDVVSRELLGFSLRAVGCQVPSNPNSV